MSEVRNGPGAFFASAPAIVYALLLAAHLALVWSLPFFPTEDGPTHVYNLVILRDLANGGRIWGDHYDFLLRPIPNLGFTAVAYPLLALFPPFAAERFFVSTYILLMGVAVPVFIRSFGKPAFPASMFVFPMMFNVSLTSGFYSYCLSIPLLLLAISLYRRASGGPAIAKFIAINAAGLVLFFAHLIAFALFLIAVAAFALALPAKISGKARELLRTAALAAPSALCLAPAYLNEIASGRLPDTLHLPSAERLHVLVSDLLTFSMVNYFAWQMVPAALVASVFILMLATSGRRSGRLPAAGTAPPGAERPLVVFASALLLVYFVAPNEFGGGDLFNSRLPWVIFLVLLPVLRMPDLDGFRKRGYLFVGIVVAAHFALNAATLFGQSGMVTAFTKGLEADAWPRGSHIMSYMKRTPRGTRVNVLRHASAHYAMAMECVDVGNYEARSDFFLVRYKGPAFSLPPPGVATFEPASIDLAAYPSIRYLVAWEIGDSDRNRVATHFRVIRETGSLTVWRRKDETT